MKTVKVKFSYKADFGNIKGELQMIVDSENTDEMTFKEANEFIRSVAANELIKFETLNQSPTQQPPQLNK